MNAIPLAALLSTIMLAGCAASTPFDPQFEQAAVVKAENISPADIIFVSRCEFALVPNGLNAGIFYQGVCLASKDKVYLRRSDWTTGSTTRFREYSFTRIVSGAVYHGTFSDQLQLRLPQYVVALHMKRDGMQGFAWDTDSGATRALLQVLESHGVAEVPSRARIAALPTAGTRTVFVPIPMP